MIRYRAILRAGLLIALWVLTAFTRPCLAEQVPGGAPCRWAFIPLHGLSLGTGQFFDRQTGFALHRGKSLYKTENGGKKWEKLYTLDTQDRSAQLIDFQFISTDEGWLFAYISGTDSVLIHTRDRGRTWTTIPLPDNVWRGFRFLDNRHGALVGEQLCHGARPDAKGVVMTTADGGRTWTERETGINVGYRWRFRAAWLFSPTDFWVAGDFLVHTTDGGKTWRHAVVDSQIPDCVTIRFNDDGVGWCMARPTGRPFLLTRDRGATWTVLRDPEELGFVRSLIFVSPNEAWLTAGSIYRSVDGGKHWDNVRDMAPLSPYRTYSDITYLKPEKTIIVTGSLEMAVCAPP